MAEQEEGEGGKEKKEKKKAVGEAFPKQLFLGWKCDGSVSVKGRNL